MTPALFKRLGQNGRIEVREYRDDSCFVGHGKNPSIRIQGDLEELSVVVLHFKHRRLKVWAYARDILKWNGDLPIHLWKCSDEYKGWVTKWYKDQMKGAQ